jgi:hypothetical protein
VNGNGKLQSLKFLLIVLIALTFSNTGVLGQKQLELSLMDHCFRVGESKKYLISTDATFTSSANICRSWDYTYYMNIKYNGRFNNSYVYEVVIDPCKRTPRNLINISSFKFEFEVLNSGEIFSIVNWNYIKQRITNSTYYADEQSVIGLFNDVIKHLFIVYGRTYAADVPKIIPTIIDDFGFQSVDGNLTLTMNKSNGSVVSIDMKEEIMDMLDLEDGNQIPTVVDCNKVPHRMKSYNKTGYFLVNSINKDLVKSATEVKCTFEDSSVVFRRFIELI